MYSKTPDIVPFPTSLRGELLSRTELERLKGGTLRLLDEAGVQFPSRQAREILAGHGARVDMKTEIVRFPPDLVQRAMSTVPRSFVLGGPPMLGGIAVLIWFLQALLLPAYPALSYPGLAVSFIVEVGLGLWLLVRGVQDVDPGAAPPG